MTAAYVDLARAHAPLLMIMAPLLGAALMLITGAARVSWLVACVAAAVGAYVSIDFAAIVLSGFAQPVAEVGVSLFADGVGVFAAALISLTGAFAVLGVGASLKDGGESASSLALALMLCVVAGWTGALFARDLIAIIVAVETAWLASVALVMLNAQRERAALNGALRMLSWGGVGAVFMLLGAGMIARATGAFAIDALPLAHIRMPNLAAAGAALVMIGLALKGGVAPLHAWCGAALGRLSTTYALGIGALGVLGALCVLTRFAAYAIAAPEIGGAISLALAVLGSASVIIGSVQAVGARNLLRLTAYAGASQAGCVLLSVALGSPAGFAAALMQLVAFAATALALYGGAAAGRVQSLEMLDGYGQRAPLASAAITVGALSLMGAPLTIGFLARWRLVEAGVGAGWWWAAGLVIVASLAGVFYGGRLVERMYFRRANAPYAGDGGVWRVALAPALIAAIAAIAIGLAPGFLLRAAATASLMLTGLVA
ncbi:MAG: proton-conducting transporter membrane subunit [Alphaproteobacteria bacterium]|nr:proton-conducting transporter membrane subunit [Alphaproteobacteria bacterium]